MFKPLAPSAAYFPSSSEKVLTTAASSEDARPGNGTTFSPSPVTKGGYPRPYSCPVRVWSGLAVAETDCRKRRLQRLLETRQLAVRRVTLNAFAEVDVFFQG